MAPLLGGKARSVKIGTSCKAKLHSSTSTSMGRDSCSAKQLLMHKLVQLSSANTINGGRALAWEQVSLLADMAVCLQLVNRSIIINLI